MLRRSRKERFTAKKCMEHSFFSDADLGSYSPRSQLAFLNIKILTIEKNMV